MSCQRPVNTTQSDSDTICFDTQRSGLQGISKGVNIVQIRIWYSYSFLDRVPVVSLAQSKTGEWNGDLKLIIWSFEHHPPKPKDILSRRLNPVTSWDEFYQKLENLKVLSLPSMENLPGYSGGLDGSSYSVEVVKDNSCRSYTYHMPQDYQDKYPEAKLMVDILNEVERELGIPWGMESEGRVAAFWNMAQDSTLKSNL